MQQVGQQEDASKSECSVKQETVDFDLGEKEEKEMLEKEE